MGKLQQGSLGNREAIRRSERTKGRQQAALVESLELVAVDKCITT